MAVLKFGVNISRICNSYTDSSKVPTVFSLFIPLKDGCGFFCKTSLRFGHLLVRLHAHTVWAWRDEPHPSDHSTGWRSFALKMWGKSEQLHSLISIPYAKPFKIKAVNTLVLKKETNQIMSLKSPYWKDWPVSRSKIYSQYTISIKREMARSGALCMTFLTLGAKGRGLGNSCAIKNVWPHKLTLNLTPYSCFLISLPSMAWLFPFISTVSFGIGEGDRSPRRCRQGLRFPRCRI